MAKIILLSSDKKQIEVDKEIIKKSILIKNMIEYVSDTDESIPIPNINENILKKVIDWCTYHQKDPIENDNINLRNSDIEEWDKKFFEIEQNYISS